MLVRQLPDDARARRDPGEDHWTRTDQLLAGIFDLLNVIDWHYVTAHTGKGQQKPRPPVPLERPGVARPRGKGTVVSMEEARRILPGAWDELTEEEREDRRRRGMAPGQSEPETAEVLT